MGGDPNLCASSDHMETFLPGEWEWFHEAARKWWEKTGEIGVIHAQCGDGTNSCGSRGIGNLLPDDNICSIGILETLGSRAFANTSASWNDFRIENRNVVSNSPADRRTGNVGGLLSYS